MVAIAYYFINNNDDNDDGEIQYRAWAMVGQQIITVILFILNNI